MRKKSASAECMDQDAWYDKIRDDPPSPPPPRSLLKPAGLTMSASAAGAGSLRKPVAKKPTAAGAKKPAVACGSAAAAKAKPAGGGGGARVKPGSDMASRKLAAIFKPGGGKPAASAPRPAKVDVGVHWDRKEGVAYILDKNGNRTPCQI
jgi:hypothetical protein